MDNRAAFFFAVEGGDFEEAERIARNQLALGGDSAPWYNLLGLVFCFMGSPADSLLYFDRALEVDSNYTEAWLNGAFLLFELGFYDEASFRMAAVNDWEKKDSPVDCALEGTFRSERENVQIRHLDTAKSYRRVGANSQAIEELKKALRFGRFVECSIELAGIYIEEKKVDQAIEILEDAQRYFPKNTRIHLLMAQCYVMNNERDGAQRMISRAELLEDSSRFREALKEQCRVL